MASLIIWSHVGHRYNQGKGLTTSKNQLFFTIKMQQKALLIQVFYILRHNFYCSLKRSQVSLKHNHKGLTIESWKGAAVAQLSGLDPGHREKWTFDIQVAFSSLKKRPESWCNCKYSIRIILRDAFWKKEFKKGSQVWAFAKPLNIIPDSFKSYLLFWSRAWANK